MTQQPAIAQILEGFLVDQRGRLSPREYGGHATVLDFLRSSLDRFGYVTLPAPQRRAWDAAFNAGDDGAFGNLFGAAELLARLDWFHDVYLPERAKASPEVQAYARTITDKLVAWLRQRGFAPAVGQS